jgi:membrane protease YdiL (CAAX protease family)
LLSSLLSQDKHFTALDTLIFFLFFLLALFSSYLIARRKEIIPKIHWKEFPSLKILIGFALIFLTSIVVNLIAQTLHLSQTTDNQEALNQLEKVIPITVFTTQTLAAAFFEELTYRVGIFEILFKKYKIIAFLVATLLFAFMHGPTDLYSWLLYGLMSLILTSFYAKYRNFYLNMSIHFLWNALGLLMMFLVK